LGNVYSIEKNMSVGVSEVPPWGVLEWLITGAATVFASAIAFVWRLAQKITVFETDLEAQGRICAAGAEATDAALIKLVERLQQLHDDQFKLRETIGALPTRSELRDAEGRILEQLAEVVRRLDRSLERRD